MPESHTVLMLGSSGVSYAADGEAMTSVMEARLGELLPETTWRCLSRGLYLTPSMARYAVGAVDDVGAATVIVFPGDMSLFWDSVANSIRERWPKLYPFALAFSSKVEAVSGGPSELSPRRWIFSAPRWLAVRIFGEAPPLRLEQGIEYASETLDALASREGIHLLCGLPQKEVREFPHVNARLGALRSAVEQKCRQHHIATIDLGGVVPWSRRLTAADGIHLEAASRRARAEALAQLIAASVDS